MDFIEQYGQSEHKVSYTFGLGLNESLNVKNNVRSLGHNLNRSNRSSLSIIGWIVDWMRFVFLPQGYPTSVSNDYISYQLWDTLQAFCSYLSGTLTTKAIMQGVGVGDAAATPLAATITWILRDGTGMIGRIVFASWKGPSLDANCKQWRLAADILNDMAMAIELCSPLMSERLFPWALCMATSMKSIVGVAGGATRAALTQHQARRGNMADVSAKDGSQETLVNLIASVSGVFMLNLLTSEFYTWMLFTFLTCLHLFSNYKAVRSLDIPILNAQRFNLLMKSYLASGEKKIESSAMINSKESVFLGLGLKDMQLCGFRIKLGDALHGDVSLNPTTLKLACSLSNEYIVLPHLNRHTISVIFNKHHCPDPLKTYYHAILLGMKLQELLQEYSLQQITPPDDEATKCEKAMIFASDAVAKHFAAFTHTALNNGWITSRHQLLVDEWQAEWHSLDKKFG